MQLIIKHGGDNEFNKQIVDNATVISSPPYYATRLCPKIHFIMGGLSINNIALILDYNNNPINGLYAASEVGGGVHSACRLGSCAITECIALKHVAGKELSKS